MMRVPERLTGQMRPMAICLPIPCCNHCSRSRAIVPKPGLLCCLRGVVGGACAENKRSSSGKAPGQAYSSPCAILSSCRTPLSAAVAPGIAMASCPPKQAKKSKNVSRICFMVCDTMQMSHKKDSLLRRSQKIFYYCPKVRFNRLNCCYSGPHFNLAVGNA